jgi:hypothetical protein
MAITNETLYTASYDSIKSFLDGISGLDPRSRFKVNWIHSSLPNINNKGFDGYPFVVLKVGVGEEDKAFDNSTSTKVFRVMISVYSNEGTEVDSISNKIVGAFKNSLNNFSAKELSSSPLDWNMDLAGKKIHFRNIGFILKERI